MRIVIGLGNPGDKYKDTRHNVGFSVIDRFSQIHGAPLKKKAFDGIYSLEKIFNKKTVLFKPLTYMNISGKAVKALCDYWGPDEDQILVIVDDFNLPLGKMRIRQNGSSGGHNGLESIKESLGFDFSRLRVGIGTQATSHKPQAPEKENMEVFVLAQFKKDERKLLNEMTDKAVKCVETWMKKGVKEAMNEYN